ncbi:RDD family protein [Nonomuraea harbinensis]|uniref:RDD family protein n=1 Tax=Nonomuraea harbinensis TaxID=1286938 RepID=A0ABW1BQL1_9ACTN|nr:RDD family protein [Nonomuraea harbinensis]
MSEVVTGDAVVLEVRVAQFPSRALAFFIDYAIQILLLIGGLSTLPYLAAFTDPAMFAAVVTLFLFLVMVGYPVIFETATRGRSLGKLALGLRVVSDDGSPERFRQALFRGLAGLVEFWAFFGAPALISSLVSQKGKRLGDLFAGTMVISERGPRDNSDAIVMPPQLASWAASLELSQVPDEVATAARHYILRWHDLSPRIQYEMGVRIATQMASFVSPAAPPGVPPHAYLSAVLAERRRREQARLMRQAAPLPYAPQTGPYGPPPVQPAPYGPAAGPQGGPNPYGPPAPPASEGTGGFAPPQ